jgi:anti-sigma-K factor RskA
MKCSEFHDVAAAFALDALVEGERLACEHHLAQEGPHEGCPELVARYERALDALVVLHPKVTPPASIWAAIEARIGKHAPRPVRWREPLAWALAAAALLAGLWMRDRGVETARRERGAMEEALANTSGKLASVEAARQECSSALAQLAERGAIGRDAVSLLEHPATRLTPLAPAGTQPYRATALYNPETKRALVISGTMPPVEGKDYELWVIAAGETAPRPAGFLRFDASGVALGELDASLLAGKRPAAFAISLEPAGGRPTPTEVVLIGKLQG